VLAIPHFSVWEYLLHRLSTSELAVAARAGRLAMLSFTRDGILQSSIEQLAQLLRRALREQARAAAAAAA
jgi:hypothetical protein